MSTSTRSRISLNAAPPSSGASSVKKLRVVGTRAIDVRAREQDQLRDVVLRDVLEDLLKAGHVPSVVLSCADPRVVHHAEVNDGGDWGAAENVARLLAADVDLVVLDVLGTSLERAPIDADDAPLAVQTPRASLRPSRPTMPVMTTAGSSLRCAKRSARAPASRFLDLGQVVIVGVRSLHVRQVRESQKKRLFRSISP